MTELNNIKELKKGLKAGTPIAIGYIPIALAFGILAKANHISLVDSSLFSLMVFAGASQFMALNLLASGVASFQIVIATAIMNFRHFLMSASLSTKTNTIKKLFIPIIAFGVTDETFSVLATSNKEITLGYSLAVNTTAYIAWVGGTVLGYLTGSILPQSVQNSMGIALYAMFIAILVPQMKKSVRVIMLSLSAGGIHTILNISNIIPQGWNLIVSIIFASLLGVFIFSDEEGSTDL